MSLAFENTKLVNDERVMSDSVEKSDTLTRQADFAS